MFVQTVLILHLMGMFFCVSWLKDLSGQMVFFNPVCLCPLPPILHPFYNYSFCRLHPASHFQPLLHTGDELLQLPLSSLLQQKIWLLFLLLQ